MKSLTNDKVKVLVVDDEKPIRRFLKASLSTYGYHVFEADSAGQAIEVFSANKPDIMILDLGLPDKNGVEVVRELRQTTLMPIIILSVRDEDSDKITALDAGADDYVTKPFHMGELIARLRAVFRRSTSAPESEEFRCGDLFVDFKKRIVQVKNEPVHLTPMEFDIILLLARNAGKVVTHRQLLKEVWNKDPQFEGADHLLRVTISNLRNKIEPEPEDPTYILTEPCVGYRLRVEV